MIALSQRDRDEAREAFYIAGVYVLVTAYSVLVWFGLGLAVVWLWRNA